MANTVLELIPVEEIEKWKPGDHIMISAGTGKCKTTWVKKVLWPYCKARGLSLYTLANRTMLRDDIQNNTDMPVMTYQMLEQMKSKQHPAWNADVVVLDECHSLATDIMLDYRRNKLLRIFENKHTIVIGLTATPVECVTRLFDPEHMYKIDRSFSQIESVFLFKSIHQTEGILVSELERGGRVLCFVRSSKRGKEMQESIPDTAFVCSRSAPEWTKTIETHKQYISRNRHWGDAQALIATKVMDVGVSIEDPDVTTVIIETYNYSVDLIQMIGRIRCCEGQRIRLYILILPWSAFEKSYTECCKKLENIYAFESNSIELAYESSLFPLILRNGERNEMMVHYLEQQMKDYELIRELGTEKVIARILSGLRLRLYESPQPNRSQKLKFNSVQVEKLQKTIAEIAGKPYSDKDMLLGQFSAFLPAALQKAKKHPSIKDVSELFKELNLPYQIMRKQYGSGKLRGKRYYILNKLVHDKN